MQNFVLDIDGKFSAELFSNWEQFGLFVDILGYWFRWTYFKQVVREETWEAFVADSLLYAKVGESTFSNLNSEVYLILVAALNP